ncbi:bacillithiol biosynthesis cysteine-adding enzyme BshC [Mammaliicoccus stepanovicii]|uniref:Putative cysteine ligase BshC n=1 Tax=Mammaliicoccus stepanovicii TaxID=643214 RepID=A0A239ZME8_9STAP|nr:bacillithiol biosynthesis cysteine-adding enzyme BshC [Mammaliicoccus stepanovicii]PNZ77908.1 bacillithiol biosynthesis cysteine-adding enzyme BshC [Mammaliicoccus stepanovicii]GGI41595.1 putative cysteine ligase BshC [Mammaliicoccus stepanovicii]SNV71716.1 bacillithiol biosynthesis cysteine-adding enzyme BshC [Mammaliicoccus stepanovicii]
MDCMKTIIDEHGSFIDRYTNHDKDILNFYEYDPSNQDAFNKRFQVPSNGRESELARVIRDYMSEFNLTEKQESNIEHLSNGHKVVIGGQQAGLFTGPLYTFHKIMSIIILSKEQSEKLGKPIVPVFWIAGEDHDFDEVNHTYAYDRITRNLNKVKYNTLDAPEKSVSKYVFDKELVYDALEDMFSSIGETRNSVHLKEMIEKVIKLSHSWTDMFKHLTNNVFKDYGLLLIDADHSRLREMERPFFKELINNYEAVNREFRKTQDEFSNVINKRMILTDSNVHVFYEHHDKRQLIMAGHDKFYLNKDTDVEFSKADLLNLIDKHPERFSNNVVTRPIMEEYLFNTLSFIGGPSEIIYWGELKGVFKLMNIEMPVVMPRMRISYLPQDTKKLLRTYKLSIDNVLIDGVSNDKQKFIRSKASDDVLREIESMKEVQSTFHHKLIEEIGDEYQNRQLLEKNNQIHQHQYQYLFDRYLLNVERENEISMRHFETLQNTLHPQHGLQERVWNPVQLMNYFGIDMFSPSTYPPLCYTFEHLTLEL